MTEQHDDAIDIGGARRELRVLRTGGTVTLDGEVLTEQAMRRLYGLLLEAKRVLDGEVEEYTDATGVKLTVKQDNPRFPGHPLLIVNANGCDYRLVNGAIERLRERAGLTSADLPDLYTFHEGTL